MYKFALIVAGRAPLHQTAGAAYLHKDIPMNAFRIFIFTFIILAVTALTACSGKADVDRSISETEVALDNGDFASGAKMADRLAEDTDTSALSVSQLCRLGMIHAILADNDVDADANMAAAVLYFSRAYQRDADSANMFVDRLPLASQSSARTAIQLLSASDEGDTVIIDEHEMPDSAYMADFANE